MSIGDDTLVTLLSEALHYGRELAKVLLIYLVFLGIERAFPAEPGQPLRRWWFNFEYQALSYYLFLFYVYPKAVALTLGALQAAYPAWFGMVPIEGHLDATAKLLLLFVIYDFFYYWFHRWQHKWPILWEQHKLHHTEESLNATTAMRHHWLEDFLRIFFISIPMAVLFDIKPTTVGWLSAALAYWPYFIHANVRLPLGMFTRCVVGPQLHRLHHSRLERHTDCNFAAALPLWDLLFGTYCHPAQAEYPSTGLASGETADSFWKANLLPFTGWWRLWTGARRARS